MIVPKLAQEAGERFLAIQSAGPASFGIIATEAARTEPEAVPNAERDRIDRLNRTAAVQIAKSFSLAADASTDTTRSQADVLDSISKERVIGTNDLKDIDYLELAIAMARGVGRVRIPEGFGTGFLIGPQLMMTNNHVIGTAEEGARCSLQLDYQDDANGVPLPVHTYDLDPALFFLTDPTLDFTIVGVKPVSNQGRDLSSYPWIKLISDPGKIAEGDAINIIQHPEGQMKQIAFRENRVVVLPQGKPQFLYYTTDTQPGSSGSPCFNDQWELVALHHQGVPELNPVTKQVLKKDHTPFRQGVDDVASINWVANEGARVSAILAFLRAATLPPDQHDLLGKAVSLSAPNPITLARSTPEPVAASPKPDEPKPSGDPAPSPEFQPAVSNLTPEVSMSNSLTFTIPLQVTVSLGSASAAPAVPQASPSISVSATPAGVSTAATEAVVVDQNYEDREGYDTNFLGFKVPLPTFGDPAMKADTANVAPDGVKHNDPFELTYYNYSVYMNKKRRTAWFSAANVDGGSDARPNIGARQGDKWYNDPRVSKDAQLGQEAFEHGIDRGHLTRREDTAWGPDEETALKSNNDTFHFTNCSLQASPFNQGKSRWQGLEQFLLEKHAKPENRKLTVITGPLFGASDPVYRNEKMSYSVRCPLQFWKVCVLQKADGSPSATAFVLGQEDIADLPGFEKEVFDVAAAQITVRELEQRTGLRFGTLSDHDHFAESGETGTLEVAVNNTMHRRKPITQGSDIVV